MTRPLSPQALCEISHITALTPATALFNGTCRYCRRDYRYDLAHGPCPAEDCPSHQTPTTLDSIERVVAGMSLVDTLRLIGRIANHEKFGDCTYAFTERFDGALAGMLEEAEADAEPREDYREAAADRACFVEMVS